MRDAISAFPARSAASSSARSSKDRCPICSQKEQKAYRPFCSHRCKLIDLGRWLGERYRVPTDEGPGSDGDNTP